MQLSGAYTIASIVDDFIERLLVNKVLIANPKIKRISGRVKPGHKFEVTMMLCELTGGPQKFVGRSVEKLHQPLNIGEKEWDAMMTDFKTTLAEHKVPAREQKEFVEKVESTKKYIVNTSGTGRN